MAAIIIHAEMSSTIFANSYGHRIQA